MKGVRNFFEVGNRIEKKERERETKKMFHLHEGIIRHSTPSRFDIGYKGEQIEKGEIGWKIISSNFVSSIIGRKSARDLFVLRTFA